MINILSSWTLIGFLAINYLSIDLGKCAIMWNGNLAASCDFVNNDLSNALTSLEQCQWTCNATLGCTHFTWTTFNGGTCWMKKRLVYKDDAFSNTISDSICGVLENVNYSQIIIDTTTPVIIDTVASQTGLISLSRFILFVSLLFRFSAIFLLYH
jgi:hypothetical protein